MTIAIKGTIGSTELTSYVYQDLAYIDGDGQYSGCTTLLAFPADYLNDPDWDVIAELPSGIRQDYVWALLHGDHATIKALKEDAGIE